MMWYITTQWSWRHVVCQFYVLSVQTCNSTGTNGKALNSQRVGFHNEKKKHTWKTWFRSNQKSNTGFCMCGTWFSSWNRWISPQWWLEWGICCGVQGSSGGRTVTLWGTIGWAFRQILAGYRGWRRDLGKGTRKYPSSGITLWCSCRSRPRRGRRRQTLLSSVYKGMDPWIQPAHLWSDLIESHGMQSRCVVNVFRPAKGACLFLTEGA